MSACAGGMMDTVEMTLAAVRPFAHLAVEEVKLSVRLDRLE